MLAIRMQRLGRKGHPTYRVVVQDSRQTPTSGKVVAMLGSYDPHTKHNTLVKDKAQLYLNNGAQPSERVVKLFASEGITLPKWVKEPSKQSREIRKPDKLRRNRPPEEKAAEHETEAPTELVPEDVSADSEIAKEEPVTEAEPAEASAGGDKPAEEESPETTDETPEEPKEKA